MRNRALLRSNVKRMLTLAPGWRGPRKIVSILSDDWFSVRTTSMAALHRLASLGVSVNRCHYMQYDHFETDWDLNSLFEVLSGVTDSHDRSPVLTANCLSANPDFDRIRESNFSEYHFQPSTDTAATIPGAENNMTLWQQAIEAGVCHPQSHGREHLNVDRWMKALQYGADPVTRAAFDHGMFGVSAHVVPKPRPSFMAALDTSGVHTTESTARIIADALDGFERMFGFRSRSYIAPNYVWGPEVEAALHDQGVGYLQSGRIQWIPVAGRDARKRKRRFLGHRNRLGQTYLVRNVDFEPSSNPSLDWVDRALVQVELAFRMRKPAVISTHRVNFMGGLDPRNRDRGLEALSRLLKGIRKNWPEVEFMNTVELGDLITGKHAA